MRISSQMIAFFKKSLSAISPEAKVYLFGSRTDDAQKGGDIDILILTPQKLSFHQISQIKIAFYQEFGEQKLDLLNFTFDEKSLFKEIVLEKAIEL